VERLHSFREIGESDAVQDAVERAMLATDVGGELLRLGFVLKVT